MEYRLDKTGLLNRLGAWDGFIKKKVHLITCGGTALTLLDIKPSTKDIDLVVPNETEYRYLINILGQLGYKQIAGAGWSRDDGFIFDIFPGKRVHTTELLESPLKEGNSIRVKEFGHIYLGLLNYYDLLITKLIRATAVDVEDCLMLIRHKHIEINMDKFINRFRETVSLDVSEEKANKNLVYFMKKLKKEGLYHEKRKAS